MPFGMSDEEYRREIARKLQAKEKFTNEAAAKQFAPELFTGAGSKQSSVQGAAAGSATVPTTTVPKVDYLAELRKVLQQPVTLPQAPTYQGPGAYLGSAMQQAEQLFGPLYNEKTRALQNALESARTSLAGQKAEVEPAYQTAARRMQEQEQAANEMLRRQMISRGLYTSPLATHHQEQLLEKFAPERADVEARRANQLALIAQRMTDVERQTAEGLGALGVERQQYISGQSSNIANQLAQAAWQAQMASHQTAYDRAVQQAEWQQKNAYNLYKSFMSEQEAQAATQKVAEDRRVAEEAAKWKRALEEAELTGMWQGKPTAEMTKAKMPYESPTANAMLSHKLGQQRLAQAAARTGGGARKGGGTLTERNRTALADAYDAIDAAIKQGLTADKIESNIDSQHTDLIRRGINPQKLKDYLDEKVSAGGVALRKPTPKEIEEKRLRARPWWQRTIDILPGGQYR